MKYLVLVLLSLTLFIYSCEEDDQPAKIKANLKVAPSELFENVSISMDKFGLATKNQVHYVVVWDGFTENIDAAKAYKQEILNGEMWDVNDALGVKPAGMQITVRKDNQTHTVNIDDFNTYAAFSSATTVVAGNQYNINLTLDTDKAIVKKDSTYVLDWNHFLAEIDKQ